jgi:hypothetical protein
MRKIFTIITLALIVAAMPYEAAQAGTKTEKRVAYTLRNMKLDAQTRAAFEPLLRQYLAEKKAATKEYDDLKDKYKAAKKAGTLTDKQATQLLDAKMVADAAELQVKKKWRVEFAKVLRAKQVFYAFDYSGDKMSKIEGKDADD